MKKGLFFLVAVMVIALAAYIVIENLPPSKDKIEGMVYKEAAVVLSYENSSNPLITALVNNAKVEVEKVERNNDGYLATCNVGNHNFKNSFESIEKNEQISTLNQFTSDFLNVLKQQEIIYDTIQVEVKKNTSGKYQVYLTEKDVDIFTGGFISFCASYYQTR